MHNRDRDRDSGGCVRWWTMTTHISWHGTRWWWFLTCRIKCYVFFCNFSFGSEEYALIVCKNLLRISFSMPSLPMPSLSSFVSFTFCFQLYICLCYFVHADDISLLLYTFDSLIHTAKSYMPTSSYKALFTQKNKAIHAKKPIQGSLYTKKT